MTGRPSSFTEEIADEICERISDGESLREICDTRGFPGRQTVLDWLEVNAVFRAKYARAREAQADYMDDQILEVANNCTPETALADRVKIGAYQWRASKLKPKVYGDKVQQEHSGSVKTTLQVVTGVPRAPDDDAEQLVGASFKKKEEGE